MALTLDLPSWPDLCKGTEHKGELVMMHMGS